MFPRYIQKNIPLALTALRLALLPFIFYQLVHQLWISSGVLFAIAVCTDVLDGYLARKWNAVTLAGTLLDPLADKVLVVGCVIALFLHPSTHALVPWWFLVVLVCKELILVVGSAFLGVFSPGVVIAPSLWGKLAMLIQSCLIGWLIVCLIFGIIPHSSIFLLIGLSLLLIGISLFHYGYMVCKILIK